MPISLIRFMLALIACTLSLSVMAQDGIPVQVRPLKEVLVDLEQRAPAEVISLNDSTISAEVVAVVSRIHADVGDRVQEGELLLELNPRDLQLVLEQAEANMASSRAQLAQAQARLRRARDLGEKQYLSAEELLNRETDVMVIEAQIRVNEASISIAERNLEKCHIVAPFAGVITQRFAQVGNLVATGNPLLNLTQTDRFELEAEIPDRLIPTLEQADSIRFVSRGESWPLAPGRLSGVVNRRNRAQTARFHFQSEAPGIGRSGEVVWQVERGLIPASLMVRRAGELGVFVNRKRVATFIPLPGAQEGRPIAVGLPLDSSIVIEGRERLQDGDAIAVAGTAD